METFSLYKRLSSLSYFKLIKIRPAQTTCLFFLILITFNSLANDYETYPVINSNTILSSEYRASTYHRIDSIGIEDGFYRFQLESNIGRYEISSLALLKKRVYEIKIVSQAIDQYVQQNDEFSGELRSQLNVSGNSAVDILTSPFSTASKLAGQLSDNFDATMAGEDPFVRDQVNRYSFKESKDPLTAAHKRNIAFQLNLDLYSSNYKVQSFLNAVANARSAGKVSAGVGLNSSYNNSLKRSALDLEIAYILKKKSLLELKKYNHELLFKLGVNAKLASAFIKNAVLTETDKVTILTYLSDLKNVSRLEACIKLILTANNQLDAFMYRQLSKMLWTYYNNTEKFTAFYNYQGRAAVITDSRRIVFFEFSDLLVWSEETEKKYAKSAKHAEASGYKGWDIVSLGEASQLANSQLQKLNYTQYPKFLEK